jgi:hypothetical protein
VASLRFYEIVPNEVDRGLSGERCRMTTLFVSHSKKDKKWAERVHKLLSDSDYQCLFLDSHPDDGIHAGADWERTLYQRLRQSRGLTMVRRRGNDVP